MRRLRSGQLIANRKPIEIKCGSASRTTFVYLLGRCACSHPNTQRPRAGDPEIGSYWTWVAPSATLLRPVAAKYAPWSGFYTLP